MDSRDDQDGPDPRRLLALIVGLAVVGGIADLILDRPASLLTPHVLFEVTLVLIGEGFSLKRIAALTGRSERTVRQHAVAVYDKSGLAGRAELSGFLLGDLLLPSPQPRA